MDGFEKTLEQNEISSDDILEAIEDLRQRDPKAAERVAATCLSIFGGYKIIENEDGSCSVLSKNSDTPRNPYETFIYGVRKEMEEKALTTPADPETSN
jgi:hypothetical protein